jgi:sporulation protein YlmC with PRC-barrel domain
LNLKLKRTGQSGMLEWREDVAIEIKKIKKIKKYCVVQRRAEQQSSRASAVA